MHDQSPGTVTAFLVALGEGNSEAKEQLWSNVYGELRRMASALLGGEQDGHMLQPTALVHEAYARMLGGELMCQKNRAYFFNSAARAMRRILIEHARTTINRKGRKQEFGFSFESLVAADVPSSEYVEALDQSLDALSHHDTRVFDVVMLRFFAGLSVDNTADVLEVSPRTVKRCWAYGRTWLFRRITAQCEDGVTIRA